MNIDAEFEKIEESHFFSNMGELFSSEGSIICIENVRKVFLEPSELEFKGCYAEVEWLPISPTQDAPFYKLPKPSAELTELRVKVNKSVMAVTRNLEKGLFYVGRMISVLLPEMGSVLLFDSIYLNAIMTLAITGRKS
ncbi:hypothetical protein [Pseudomonas savastanoi]|uniref:hypothetical protein n=1 Tax=Pseudomonas savastanoi TaxID=29438 RepID=UPI001E3CD1B2|nr:hypothetical protein [Pseudomonas savastanoi]